MEWKMDARIITGAAEIKDLLEDRNRSVLRLPDYFTDSSLSVEPNISYTLEKAFTLEGKATFENKNSLVKVSPAAGKRSSFSFNGKKFPLNAADCVKGNHNIQLGEVKIIEHPLAWMLAFGVYVDIETAESSLPTFDFCDRPYLDGLIGNLQAIAPRKSISVSKPFGLVWEKGYCMVEPPENSKESEQLIIDHQVSYLGTSIGKARIKTVFEPNSFAYYCDARTTAFRTKSEAEKFYQVGLAGGLKDYPFTLENVLLLDEERIYNSREKFKDRNSGFDFEFLCHEIIDISSWLRFVEEEYEGRFVGKMTTFLFDHHKQIDIAQSVCDPSVLEKHGVSILR
ncbi:UDP-3-O-[3-hydroxymyristoyl] N-acetylglucosamine deacetylase [Leptospira broomii serovar Hurstbridge str. 5399]|uniref:UDP-3-O-[3-hydroxymyristoyl] N-acetylglucosamine deacetylase n=2 Tax=Leptospira broomii TaxID=301541 RepID=T0F839_9LEPT|nr:UDP-3-O-[3-hydroxymyristoyl] N-acetylglucosamine deacetylase [Leptospira broomii serovar Hurstbridge str. 5399]